MKKSVMCECPEKTFKRLVAWLFFATLLASCGQQGTNPQDQETKLNLSQLFQEEEFWEGNSLEYKEVFFTNDDGVFCKVETKNPFSGVIKVRSRKGTIASLSSYTEGLMNGDFFEWHDNGKLKSKFQKEKSKHQR